MTTKRTILLVDDEKDLIEPICDRIEAVTGYKVVMAGDGDPESGKEEKRESKIENGEERE